MRKRITAVFALALVCALLLTACGGSGATPAGGGVTPAGGTSADGGATPAGGTPADGTTPSAEEPTAAADGSTTAATSAAEGAAGAGGTLEPVTLQFYFYDGKKAMTDAVWAAIGEKYKAELNVTFDVQFIAGTDYKDKMLVKAAAGDKWDLNYDAEWVSYLQMAARDAYMPLDELLPVHAPDLWARYQEDGILQSAMSKGKIVAMPWTLVKTTRPTFAWRGDLAEAAGIEVDPATVTGVEQADAIMTALRAAYPEKKIMDLALDEVWWAKYQVNPVAALNFYIDLTDPTCKVTPYEQTEAFREMAQYAKKWQDAGIIWKDVLTDLTNRGSMLNQGLLICDWGTYESSRTKSNFVEPDAFMEHQLMYPDNLATNRTPVANVACIPRTSENPERTLMFMNMLETSQELYDMVHYGILGETYVLNGEEVAYPEGMTSANSNYMDFGGRWALWKPQFMRPDAQYYPGFWVDEGEFALDTPSNVWSPLEGFNFDTEAISAEVAQRNQIFDDAFKLINVGLAGDADQAVDKLIADLQGANLELIQTELQKQIDAFLAAKGA